MDQSEYENIFHLENNYWWYVGLQELVESYVNKNSNTKSISILDAGCGTGGMLKRLPQYGNAEGFDFSEQAVELCKKRGISNVKLDNLNTWSSTQKYDIIISLDVLYHAAIESDEKVIRKFHEALNENGVLILNLPAFAFLRRKHDDVVHGNKRYVKSKILLILKNNGFNGTIKVSYRLPHLFILLILKKAIDRIFPSAEQSDLVKLPKWLNNSLLTVNRIENKLLLLGINIPFGSSLFIVSKKMQ